MLFFKNHAENEAAKLNLDIFLFFKKDLHKVKINGQHISLNIFW